MTTSNAATKAETPKTTETTLAEIMDSINGYDELGIEKELERGIESLSDNSTLMVRAAVAIHRTREGDKHHVAWKFAMELKMKDLMGYFAKGGTSTKVDAITGEADDPAGKDES